MEHDCKGLGKGTWVSGNRVSGIGFIVPTSSVPNIR